VTESQAPKRTNSVAMVAIVLVWFNPLAGLILGHIALIQISRTGELGRTSALVSAIAGWVLVSVLFFGVLSAVLAGTFLTGLPSGLVD
jgi:hypothetical protein